MAIYHCNIKIGSRSKGQSAIAAAAYRSGTKLVDKETGLTSDFTRKKEVVYSEIDLCKNAPSEYANRENLWNAVHKVEKSKNAQLWREIEVALPKEFNRQEQIETLKEYVKGLTDRGMCADWSIHDKGDGNPHAHIMLTMRSIKPDGTWAPKCKKVYILDENGNKIFQKLDKNGCNQYKCKRESYNDWDKKERIEEWRKEWARCCNSRLDKEHQIDHRSYKRQGKIQIPTIHEGYVARKMEKLGKISDRVSINRKIKEDNEQIQEIERELENLRKEKAKIIEERDKKYNEKEEFIESFGLHNWRIIKEMQEESKAINILSEANINNAEELKSKILEIANKRDDLRNKIQKSDDKIKETKEILNLKKTREKNKPFYDEANDMFFGKKKYEEKYSKEIYEYKNADKKLRKYYPGRKIPTFDSLNNNLVEYSEKRRICEDEFVKYNKELEKFEFCRKMINKILKEQGSDFEIPKVIGHTKEKGYIKRDDFRKKSSKEKTEEKSEIQEKIKKIDDIEL